MAPYAVSLVPIRVNCGVQRSVYYVSKSLHEIEVQYLPLEKAILAVVLGTRKLPYYFQAHTVVVLTQLLLKATLRSADYTGRIAKWGTILGAFDIKYMPRTSIKRTSPRKFGGRIHQAFNGKVETSRKHGWKISWHNLLT